MPKNFKIIFTLENVQSYLHSADSLDDAIMPVAMRVLNDRNIGVECLKITDNTLRIVVRDELPDPLSIPDSHITIVEKEDGKNELFELTLHEWLSRFNLLIISEKTHISRFIPRAALFKKEKLDRNTIRRLCMENGYSLRLQENGLTDLNEYVFETAQLFYELGLKGRG